ncbi:MIF4G domain protein [Ancylostoma ceylanicum]|uniref:MIF4G domain protein n=1 Tax=Ancylostoma ceylanicum TaxID=53326 RepID=A0A0D6LSZ6_9BILA|nr:MIF4G domain protein [Ancylostoma ceylanicum]
MFALRSPMTRPPRSGKMTIDLDLQNLVMPEGLLVRSIMQAQAFSPVFSHVYAAFVAVINSKFPHIGELLLRRLIVQFKRSFRRNDKGTTITVSKFIAHLINQRVAHEVLALEIMILMLETPTDDSVEVSIAFLKECGAKLTEVSPRALDTIFTRLRGILQDGDSSNLDKRVQYMIEVVMTIRKDNFKVGQYVFKLDPDFEKNEKQYEEIRAEIIGDADDSDEEGSDDEDEASGDEGGEQPGATAAASGTTEIIDNTEQNLVAFRREVYLTIQSSLDFQEAAHKLLKMRVPKEMETELCHMLVDCCCQQRTYERFYGLLCERFCRLRKEYQETFEKIACDTYATIHRFDITKLRNMARLVSHLLFTDAISWTIFTDVKLTENDTTSSGRIYLKYIFQELCESMGLAKLYERTSDPTLQTAFAGLFPRDNPQNTRFAINFFTLTGLGGLT